MAKIMSHTGDMFDCWVDPGVHLLLGTKEFLLQGLWMQPDKCIKAQMLLLGLEPGAAVWKAQTNPPSYNGIPS